MKLDKQTKEKIEELNMMEQNLQNFSMQKQAFQLELNETESALREVGEASGEIYKITGQIMIRTEKTGVTSELNEKKKLLDLRINAVEKQEKILNQKLEQLKKDVEDKFKNQKAEL